MLSFLHLSTILMYIQVRARARASLRVHMQLFAHSTLAF